MMNVDTTTHSELTYPPEVPCRGEWVWVEPIYRMLEAGEEILASDEYQLSNGKWRVRSSALVPDLGVGLPYRPDFHFPTRRRVGQRIVGNPVIRHEAEVEFCEPGSPSFEKLRTLYSELILAVARKFPNETRHQTALRYIKEREQDAAGTGCVGGSM